MELNPGDVICDQCNGKGFFCFVDGIHVTEEYCIQKQCLKTKSECPGYEFQRCPKCRGMGKLDWIENAIGKRSIRI